MISLKKRGNRTKEPEEEDTTESSWEEKESTWRSVLRGRAGLAKMTVDFNDYFWVSVDECKCRSFLGPLSRIEVVCARVICRMAFV